MIDNELKKKFVDFIKANLPSDSMSEEDIAWIMDECDKGNRPTYDDFVKARRQPKNIESGDVCCSNCKHFYKKFNEEPCKKCLVPDNYQPYQYFEEKDKKEVSCLNCKNSDAKWYEEPCKKCIESRCHILFEKRDVVVHKDDSPLFGPNMMRQEEFKIPDSIQIMIDQNKKPNLIIPQLDGIENKLNNVRNNSGHIMATTEHTDSVVVGITKTVRDISNSVEKLDKDIPSIADCISIKIDKLMEAVESLDAKLIEAVESLDAKLDILDQRIHDFRQHQILKDTKCEEEKKDDILERPEPKFKVDDEVQVVADIFIVKYTIERIYWSNGPASSIGWWYVLESSSDKTRRFVQEDLLIPFKQEEKDISDAKEPPKFKVGDIVKVTNDSRNNDFFVCRIKWSEHSKQWNYLISLDLEGISGAFWRMEKWLTKSEDYSEPLFKVGDKVKLKHGKVVYEVYSITYFMHDKKKVYRYKIGHSASTTHYENENRLIKA